MTHTEYSGTPLARKLGIKKGAIIKTINAPENYFSLFTEMPDDVLVENNSDIHKDVIHFFVRSRVEFMTLLPELKSEIRQNGMIWVSWPKKSSKVSTDLTETVIRDFALSAGLVDIKICAVDEIWSGLKLVIPVKDRK